MVLNDGLVKITDFGIARMRNNEIKTMTGMILGSPKYMSPEQVSGKRADTRSDIFSLGVVLYEMLTGTSPFVADNIHGVMYQTMNFNPPAPRTLNPDLPEVFNFIIAKALAKNLDDRYEKAKDLSHDLRLALSELSGESTAPRTSATANDAADAAEARFVEPESPLTRQEDKEARILEMADDRASAHSEADSEQAGMPGQASESTNPALGLSKAFDSFDATMRLAALTGMEKDLDKFSETQKIARLKSLADAKRGAAASAVTSSDSSTWQQTHGRFDATASSGPSATHMKLIWIGSACMVLAAAALFVLR
jgi:serine/threonine-protein kinase